MEKQLRRNYEDMDKIEFSADESKIQDNESKDNDSLPEVTIELNSREKRLNEYRAGL